MGRVYFRVDNRVSRSSVYSICTGRGITYLPFVGDKSRSDLVDLVVLEHRSVLIEDTWLREEGSSGVRSGHAVCGAVDSIKAISSNGRTANLLHIL